MGKCAEQLRLAAEAEAAFEHGQQQLEDDNVPDILSDLAHEDEDDMDHDMDDVQLVGVAPAALAVAHPQRAALIPSSHPFQTDADFLLAQLWSSRPDLSAGLLRSFLDVAAAGPLSFRTPGQLFTYVDNMVSHDVAMFREETIFLARDGTNPLSIPRVGYKLHYRCIADMMSASVRQFAEELVRPEVLQGRPDGHVTNMVRFIVSNIKVMYCSDKHVHSLTGPPTTTCCINCKQSTAQALFCYQ